LLLHLCLLPLQPLFLHIPQLLLLQVPLLLHDLICRMPNHHICHGIRGFLECSCCSALGLARLGGWCALDNCWCWGVASAWGVVCITCAENGAGGVEQEAGAQLGRLQHHGMRMNAMQEGTVPK
jgi:hypothetical protein